MTYGDHLKKTIQKLKKHNVEDPSFEAGLLLAWLINKDISYIYSHCEDSLSPEQEEAFNSIIERRCLHEPYAYITGQCGFMGLNFFINNHVLIPREDTEILVQGALHALGKNQAFFTQPMFRLKKTDSYRILDVGTGSGCIAICLAKSVDSVIVDAIDISPEALKIAKKNASCNNVQDKINFINIDFLNSELKCPHHYDIIISNPPYIPSKDMDDLMDSVKNYEPHIALDGGKDGIVFYRALVGRAKNLLAVGGILIVECGFNQEQQVLDLFYQNNFKALILKDLSGISRVITGTLSEQPSP